MRNLAVTLLALVTSVSGGALTPCFASFYGLASTDEAAKTLVATTYEALLDLPKADEAKRQWLNEILTAADPFARPHDSRLETLGKKMHELKAMLKQLGWSTPEIQARLLSMVKRKVEARNHAGADLDGVIATTRVFPLNGARDAIPSRDGRYVIGQPHGRNGKSFTILDTSSGTSTEHAISAICFPRQTWPCSSSSSWL